VNKSSPTSCDRAVQLHRYSAGGLLRARVGIDGRLRCVPIHTLNKQTDNRSAMIERQHSKLTATMAADYDSIALTD
jgi:hypothetical protein